MLVVPPKTDSILDGTINKCSMVDHFINKNYLVQIIALYVKEGESINHLILHYQAIPWFFFLINR